MPIHKLTPTKIERATEPGWLADGGGLYIKVTGPLTKSGVFRFVYQGREHWIGLGPYGDISLDEMREAARQNRLLLRAGSNPKDARDRAKQEVIVATASTISFAEAATRWLTEVKDGETRSLKSQKQRLSQLQRFIFPALGNLSLDLISATMVADTLRPIWLSKAETARKVRERMVNVFDWAKAHKYRCPIENPADLARNMLPKHNRIAATKNRDSLPFADLPAFMGRLDAHGGVAAAALKLLILANVRSGDIVGQKGTVEPLAWLHIDLKARTWTIPVTKSGNAHTVPLSKEAIAVLDAQPRAGDRVFPTLGRDDMQKVMRDLGHGKEGPGVYAVPHGFRATFKTWADKTKRFHDDYVEAAMAHEKKDKLNTGSYRRSTDFLDERRPLMQAWADYATGPARPETAEIVQLRA